MQKRPKGRIAQGYMHNPDGTMSLGALAGSVNVLGLQMDELADDINATRSELSAVKAVLRAIRADLEATSSSPSAGRVPTPAALALAPKTSVKPATASVLRQATPSTVGSLLRKK